MFPQVLNWCLKTRCTYYNCALMQLGLALGAMIPLALWLRFRRREPAEDDAPPSQAASDAETESEWATLSDTDSSIEISNERLYAKVKSTTKHNQRNTENSKCGNSDTDRHQLSPGGCIKGPKRKATSKKAQSVFLTESIDPVEQFKREIASVCQEWKGGLKARNDSVL